MENLKKFFVLEKAATQEIKVRVIRSILLDVSILVGFVGMITIGIFIFI